MSEQEKTRSEEFHLKGDELVAKIKDLVRQGNIRRISIRDEEGRTIVDLPLTWGVVGVLVAPQLAALGALAALITKCSIVVELVDEGGSPGTP
jgi:hypothetical protein